MSKALAKEKESKKKPTLTDKQKERIREKEMLAELAAELDELIPQRIEINNRYDKLRKMFEEKVGDKLAGTFGEYEISFKTREQQEFNRTRAELLLGPKKYAECLDTKTIKTLSVKKK